MKLDQLIDKMTVEGDQLAEAARAIGGVIDFNPYHALDRDLDLETAGLWSPNRHCRLVEAKDGWLAVNLAREDDHAAVPAWIGCALNDEPWKAVVEGAKGRTTGELLDQAILLGLPVAAVGEATPAPSYKLHPSRTPVGNMEVVDLSALWAGPYCGGLLAEAGMTVTKFESITRRDPTIKSTPRLWHRLHHRKKTILADLPYPPINELIDKSRILITSARPQALARLGLTEEALFTRNSNLLWVAITAHGWHGDAAMRVGFGDDCAAAGGLVDWVDGEPNFIGDALADPLTGLRAARLAIEAVRDGKAGLIDVALAPTAASFVI